MLSISTDFGIYLIVATQITSGLFGWFKMRKMDFQLFFFIDAEIKKGENPIVGELWEEALVLAAACLLIIPGFLTDIIGVICWIPQLRLFFIEYLDDV